MVADKNFDINVFEDFLSEVPNLEIKSPAVTFGSIFKHEHKENFISDWLAYLLDSKNTGTNEPLESLINIAFDEENHNIDFSNVNIQREFVFSENKRRIDFLIKTPSHIIGIENKIWSGLQYKQLKDYNKQINSLQTEYKNRGEELEKILILLCPENNSVKEQLSDDFKLVTYDVLIGEFKKIRINCLENIRASILMEDFISHVEEYFMNSTNNNFNFEFIQFQNQNQKKISDFNDNIENSKKQFNKKLQLEIINNGFGDDWTVLPRGGSTYIMQVYKSFWNNGNIHFELLTDGCFPPNKVTVVFHIEGKSEHNEALKNMKKEIKYDSIDVEIKYDDYAMFEQSIKDVVEILIEFDNKYTKKVDTILAK